MQPLLSELQTLAAQQPLFSNKPSVSKSDTRIRLLTLPGKVASLAADATILIYVVHSIYAGHSPCTNYGRW